MKLTSSFRRDEYEFSDDVDPRAKEAGAAAANQGKLLQNTERNADQTRPATWEEQRIRQ